MFREFEKHLKRTLSRPLTPLKETYGFTSLTIIGMTKILCNREPPKYEVRT
jgi:hypothetical protein